MKGSPILRALAQRYTATQAGRTGVASRDLFLDYEEFLAMNGCKDGDRRVVAERDLAHAGNQGWLELETHRRDPKLIQRIRFRPSHEPELFAAIGEPTPTERRCQLARQFLAAVDSPAVPPIWRASWQAYCQTLSDAALTGTSVEPFSREDVDGNAELLRLLPQLLAWPGESLIRFASCALCGDSKRLEQLKNRLGTALQHLSDGKLGGLDDLNIVENPRFVLMHGPIRLHLAGEWMDFRPLAGPFRLSQLDIERADAIETSAQYCLTVENETSFHELAQKQSGELLVQTSFPGSATVALLKRLPARLDFSHFGDSDEAGFEILEALIRLTGRPFRPLHMKRGRRPFEQESLGRPTLTRWPFYRVDGLD